MKIETYDDSKELALILRLDRLQLWPYSALVLWVVGAGYLIAFFDITNVAFGSPVFSKVLHFAPGQEALPITASLIGYVFGALVNSNLSDIFGRKSGIAIAILLFTLGCIATAFAFNPASMVAGHLITGMGIGTEIAVISAYTGKLAPASVRGRYTAIANIFAMIGQGIVPIVALWLVPNFSWGWRGMFVIGALGGLTLSAFPLLPESPRWLLNKRHYGEDEIIINAAEARAAQPTRSADASLYHIEAVAEVHTEGFPLLALFRPPYLGRVVLLFSLWSVWYMGIYTWLGLGPSFFVGQGYTLKHSIVFLLAGSVGYPLGAIISSVFSDKFERKYTIMPGLTLWTACFIGIALTRDSIVIYGCVFFLAASLGFYVPMLYTLSSESFPRRSRATGCFAYGWGRPSCGLEQFHFERKTADANRSDEIF
jgi:putative MFS transporter